MSKRVRTLLRVSSRQQLHDNDIPIQRAEAARYIELHKDWVFDREYMEKAVSAYKNSVEDREVLQEILSDARERKFDILLAYMSDRIGRQEEYSFYVAALNRLGIEVWTIRDGQLKTREHTDRLLNYIRFWQNEGESKKTGMRVRDTQREMARAGKFVGGKAPFGYRLVPSGEISNHGRALKKREIAEEQAAVVKRIYRLAVYQGMGYEKIAKALNEEKIPAIETDKWKAATIAGILKNPVYCGYPCINRRISSGGLVRLDRKDWIYAKEQIKELVIVPPELWEMAQEIREARKNKIAAAREDSAAQYMEQYQAPFSTKGRLALIGSAFCGYCGKRLKNGSYCNRWTTKSGEKKTAFTGRYVCPQRCAERACYSQKYLEDAVFATVEGYLGRLKSIDITEELREIRERQKADILRELTQIQKERRLLIQDKSTLEEKIPEAIRGDYCFSAEKLSSIIKEKERALAESEGREKEIQDRLSQTDLQTGELEKYILKEPDWREEFQSADTATKQMLLAAIIDRIEVRNGDIRIKFKIRLEDLLTPETVDHGVPE